jgi:predicted RNA-binding Zn-ribbon protein involved in translation (DUF1610 family)
MSIEKIELDEDDVTKALNKRLEEDAKQEALDKEVESRLTKKRAEAETKRKALEVHEAIFKDETTGKEKKITSGKTKMKCWNCGGTDMEKQEFPDDADTYVYRGQDISEVWKCNDCGRSSGVEG